MIAFVNKFKTFPEDVKNGIIFLYFSWIWFVIILYSIGSELLEPRMLIGGIALCILVPMIKNWARALCVLCNAIVILQTAIPAYVFLFMKNDYKMGLIWTVNILFFSITSYYLLTKETAAYFKMHVKKPETPTSDKP